MDKGSTSSAPQGLATYTITWESRGVVRRFQGELTGRVALESLDRTLGDARYDDVRYAIADLRNVTHFDISDDEVDGVAARYYGASLSNRRVVVAVLARQPAVARVVERVEAVGMPPLPLRVFDDEAAARDWIAQELQQRGW